MSPLPKQGVDALTQRLDRLLGKVEALAATLEEQNEKIGRLAERTAMLEQLGSEAKQIVEAWTAATTSLQFMKWFVGLIATFLGVIAAMKHWLQR